MAPHLLALHPKAWWVLHQVEDCLEVWPENGLGFAATLQDVSIDHHVHEACNDGDWIWISLRCQKLVWHYTDFSASPHYECGEGLGKAWEDAYAECQGPGQTSYTFHRMDAHITLATVFVPHTQAALLQTHLRRAEQYLAESPPLLLTLHRNVSLPVIGRRGRPRQIYDVSSEEGRPFLLTVLEAKLRGGFKCDCVRNFTGYCIFHLSFYSI